jgi:hypothetical protein
MISPSKPAQPNISICVSWALHPSILAVPIDYARQHDLAPGTPVYWQLTPDGVQIKFISPSTAQRSVELKVT